MVKIFGIDPGPHYSAIVGIDKSFNIFYHNYLENKLLEKKLEELSNPYDILAIEWIQSYSIGVGQDIFLTCRAVGRFEKGWKYQKNIYLYARPTILSHITGGVRGKKKAQVRQACLIRFGETKKGGPLHGLKNKDHTFDAFVVAVIHLDAMKMNAIEDLECTWARIK